MTRKSLLVYVIVVTIAISVIVPWTATAREVTETNSINSIGLWCNDFGYDAAAGGWRKNQHPRMIVDANNDGRADIVGFGNAGVYVALSSGSGFGSTQLWASDFGYDDAAGGWRMDKHLRMMGDVNNDGRADIVGFGNTGVYVALSSGSSFGSTQPWSNDFGYDDAAGGWRMDKHLRMMADVNNDGRTDIVGFGNTGVYVALSSGSGFGSTQLWSDNFGYDDAAGGWRIAMHPRILADINDDGKNDIIGFGNAGVYRSLSTGSSFDSPTLQIADYGYYGGGWRVDVHPRMMGDVDGDGKFDIIGFGNAGTYVSPDLLSVTPPPSTCDVPFLSQRDPRWISHPLRTAGVCSSYCNTIGRCGCTLTSSAMIFKYYNTFAKIGFCSIREVP